MLLLTTTSDLLQIITGSAISTDIVASFVDITTSTFTPGSQQTNTTTATTTTIVAAPASSTQRQIKMLSVTNRSTTTPQTVTIQKSSTTAYNVTGGITLQPGEVLYYQDGIGFSVRDINGQIKETNATSPSLTATYVGYGSSTSALTGSSNFTYNSTTNVLSLQGATNSTQSLAASGVTISYGNVLLTNTSEIASVNNFSIGTNAVSTTLTLYTAAVARMAINANGAVTINAPASGYPLTLNAPGSGSGSSASYTPALLLSTSNGNYTNNSSATSTLVLANANTVGQTSIDFSIAGTLSGRIRNDYAGNLNFTTTSTGGYNFFVGGDSGVGTTAMTIASTGGVVVTGNGSNAGSITITSGSGSYAQVALASSASGAANIYLLSGFSGTYFAIYSTAGFLQTISSGGVVTFSKYSAGTLSTSSAGVISASSDENLKKNIIPYTNGIDVIKGINPIKFQWSEESEMDPGKDTEYVGFSAQNVQSNIPEAVGQNASGHLSLDIRAILAALVNTVKEQQTQIDALTAKIAALGK
jgi:hypothetical protein